MNKVKCSINTTAVIILLFLGGCTVGPDYERPELEMPAGWGDQSNIQVSKDSDDISQWWTLLNDPVLNDLIEQAAGANLDARASMMRIFESRASRDYAAGSYSPRADFLAGYSRMRDSQETRFSMPGMPTDPYDLHSAGFDASWEIDLFGQIRRSVESSQASLEASIEDYNDVIRTLFAEVARNYVELRTIQERIRYAEQNIQAQEETVELTQKRFDTGLAGKLDVAQSKLNLANTEAEIPSLNLAEIQTVNRIAVLLGKYPQQLAGTLDSGSIPGAFDPASPPVPADLLRRRADIRRAERQLAAQTARIGVAEADLYPSFSLTGVFSFQAEELVNVGRQSSRSYSFGPGFRWYIMGGNRVRSNIQRLSAAAERARIFYEQTVLGAVEETANALASLKQDKLRLAALERSTEQSELSVKLVREQYANGLTDFQNVLDMQRTLWMQQDRLASSRGQVVLDLIRIYKAIGGGWQIEKTEAENLSIDTVETGSK